MKNNLAIASFLALLFCGQQLVAQTAYVKPVITKTQTPPPSLDVQIIPDPDQEKFTVAVSNPFGEKIRLVIEGSNGAGYTEYFSAPSFRRKFNMSDAEDGSYKVIVTAGKKTIKRSIVLSTDTEIIRNIAVNE